MSLAHPETLTETATRSSTIVDTYPEQKPKEETPKITHIVRPPENKHIWEVGMTTKQMVEWAILKGTYLVALCGEEWYPKRNPKASEYDICDACLTRAKEITQSGGIL